MAGFGVVGEKLFSVLVLGTKIVNGRSLEIHVNREFLSTVSGEFK
jgi:hypothetical protein